jgi:hypothetical protein
MKQDIKVVRSDKQSALVEYQDGNETKRVIVPVSAVVDNVIDDNDLALGIPYGLAWANLVTPSTNSKRIEAELRRAGIWTAEDALKNAPAVQGAVQAAYSIDFSTIMRIAKENLK